jgi:hypothetical protein
VFVIFSSTAKIDADPGESRVPEGALDLFALAAFEDRMGNVYSWRYIILVDHLSIANPFGPRNVYQGVLG